VDDGDGAAGGHRGAGRGPLQKQVARTHGVSRRWVITLVQRFLSEGEAGLVPRSRRPRSSPGRTAQAVEDEIIALRKDLDRGGHEAGAATIAAHLQQRHGPDAVPAVSTIWRILSARGFVTPQPHKRPKSSWQRFVAEAPNERWQLDITHYRLADATDVEVLNILDDHSRLCLTSHARRIFTAGDVDTVFTTATSSYGDPASLLSDNGAVFTGAPRRGGRVALELTCHARGIRFTHSRPYHPQTWGKVERFHQTLKKWLDHPPDHRASTPSAFGYLPRLLQPDPATSRSGPPHPAADVCGTAESLPDRHPDRHRPLPRPPRPHRQRRSHHAATQQPPTPHRTGPPPHRNPRAGPGPRSTRPRPQHRRRTITRTSTRPHPRLPTTNPNVNDVARHLCTMSRDITHCAPGRTRTCDLEIRRLLLYPAELRRPGRFRGTVRTGA
jgi:transposase InsO family protein